MYGGPEYATPGGHASAMATPCRISAAESSRPQAPRSEDGYKNGVFVRGETINDADCTKMNARTRPATQRFSTNAAPVSVNGSRAASTGTSTFNPVPSL